MSIPGQPLPVLDDDACETCGVCCRLVALPPFESVDDVRFRSLPQEFQAELYDRLSVPIATRHVDSPCVWYDEETRRCRHYELRPEACRDFEVGSFYCRMQRRKWHIEPY